jgi:hypothetical protein
MAELGLDGELERDGEAIADPPSPTRMVEWYRPDQGRRVLRIWALGVAMVASGALCAIIALRGLGSLGQVVPVARGALAIVGALCVLGGPLLCIVRLLRAMREDDYVALQSNGIVIARGGEVELLSWSELDTIEHLSEPSEALLLKRRDGELHELGEAFAGIDLALLGRRISHLRSKVLMDLLR